ncbi:MAG: nitrile hydratase subunit beta [Chloroflexi bacterium]|nr:nitrile hydratase subunit beta [Chloroflexota bacterium]
MDGVHDLGGMHGFGPVIREAGEPVFHAPWEATVVALMRSARANGVFNIDEFRHAIERMPPARYLSATYYERWLEAVATLAIEKGLTTAEELERRSERPESSRDTRRRTPTTEPAAVQSAPGAPDAVVSPTSSFRPETSAPRFNAGDAIVTIRARPKGHTRLPRYARGKRGRVHAYRGFQVFPDASAHGRGENPQPLYSVRFEGDELWGDSGEPSQAVYLDLWESYLLPAR